jgi:uncharacterized repeat protein (TIGR03806 family)
MKHFLLLLLSIQLASADADLAHLANLILSRQPPQTLSKTFAFEDLKTLAAHRDFIPYDLNVAFWSDGAAKQRWVYLPKGEKVTFSPNNEWRFPPGTLFMKQFNWPLDEETTGSVRRLETRFTVVAPTGGIVGVTYKWQSDGADADLLMTNLVEFIGVRSSSGIQTQSWYYPGPADCNTCHTLLNGGVLGLNTRQLNRYFVYGKASAENQLVHWKKRGLFQNAPEPLVPSHLPKLMDTQDSHAPLGERARSWLDANCAHCHRPGGTVASFDARFDTELSSQNLINGPILIDEGIDNARVIAPRDPWRSILLLRASTLEPLKMPPIAHEHIDPNGVALLRDWIESLAGPQVLAPPRISPPGGDFTNHIAVKVSHEIPGAVIHYTLDGAAPGKSSPVYKGEILLAEPATIRARAFKDGFTRSISSQETFIITGPSSPTSR